MAKIISGKNGKLLEEEKEEKRLCSCTKDKKDKCPLDNKCLSDNIVYQATVTKPNQENATYIGQTSCDFKKRLAVHNQTFKDQTKNGQTALSNHIHDLELKGIEYSISWKIIDRGKSFSL